MITIAFGFSTENQEKHVLSWHGEIKQSISFVLVSCTSGAVLQGEGQQQDSLRQRSGEQSRAALGLSLVLVGKLRKLGSPSAD